jgi:hypothetical protein
MEMRVVFDKTFLVAYYAFTAHGFASNSKMVFRKKLVLANKTIVLFC